MKTAVEWLIDEIDMQYPDINIKRKEWMIDKAKEMEKEQHKQTWLDSTTQFDNAAEMIYKKDFEQYYNKTFKQPEQCKCGQQKVGGYSCQRTDCNQNL
jgi:hypothetical protein